MSELFTAEKARELREQSVERILQEKRLEHENKIKKLIDETYSIQEILTNIQSFSYDGLDRWTYCTGIMIMRDGTEDKLDLETEKIVEVLNYLGYRTYVTVERNNYKRIVISW